MNYQPPMANIRKILSKSKQVILEENGIELDIEKIISLYVGALYDDNIFENLKKDIKRFYDLSVKKSLHSFVLELEFVKKEFPSYFFTGDELKDFLINTKVGDIEPVIETIKKSGSFYTVEEDDFNNVVHYFPMHLRFPDSRCISCCLFVNSDDEKNLCLYITDDKSEYLSTDIKDLLKEEKENPECFELVKLVLNFFYYLKAFPDAVKEGKPVKEKNNGVKQAASFTVNTAESIVESRSQGIKRGRVTHFRKGHFRHLRSDYFVNKHDRYVFINDTIVHGREAKTVEKQQ